MHFCFFFSFLTIEIAAACHYCLSAVYGMKTRSLVLDVRIASFLLRILVFLLRYTCTCENDSTNTTEFFFHEDEGLRLLFWRRHTWSNSEDKGAPGMPFVLG